MREKNNEEIDLTDILNRLSFRLDTKEEKTEPVEAITSIEDIDEKDDDDDENGEIKDAKEVSKANIDKDKFLKKKSAGDQTIRVDVQRLDSLLNMMGELVLGRNSMMQAVNKLLTDHEGDYELDRLSQSSNSINFITTELQMAVMKMRMQPVGKVCKKFPRLVRDLARDAKKNINLEISGEGTELDKSVIEEIGDPLVHIIRNSCDHGIETPDERIAKGKNPEGTIQLKAYQEGSNIVIQIEDDGKGFDIRQIRIGFPAERGLGLAAMDERTRMLGGHLDISSQKNKGTKVTFNISTAKGGNV